jgi:hypothetical protein
MCIIDKNRKKIMARWHTLKVEGLVIKEMLIKGLNLIKRYFILIWNKMIRNYVKTIQVHFSNSW